MLPTQAKIPNVGNMHTIKNLITKIQCTLFPDLEEHFEENKPLLMEVELEKELLAPGQKLVPEY